MNVSPTPTRASVVIAAHNEAQTIGRCLSALLAGAEPGELEVIVVCNGCDDDTAEIAAGFGGDVRVLTLDKPSKILALNLADREASHFPRFYVDADVQLTTQALRELAQVLAEGALAVGPIPELDLADRSWPIRAYFRLWENLPEVREHLVGRGVYALSQDGRARFGDFPEVIADDLFVSTRFRADERRCVESCRSQVQVPRTFQELLARKTRVFLGNQQLSAGGHARVAGEAPADESSSRLAGWLDMLVRQPRLIASLPVYVAVGVIAKMNAARRFRRGELDDWGRDAGSRSS